MNYNDFLFGEVRESGNAFGTVRGADGIPVICGHGGSMWLCAECAAKAPDSSFTALPPRPPSESIQRTRQARKDSHNPFFAD